MALYIITKAGTELQWHVGQSKPYKDNLRVIEEVAFIQADGDELNKILILFKNSIPTPHGERVCLWSGDLAHTILLNL